MKKLLLNYSSSFKFNKLNIESIFLHYHLIGVYAWSDKMLDLG